MKIKSPWGTDCGLVPGTNHNKGLPGFLGGRDKAISHLQKENDEHLLHPMGVPSGLAGKNQFECTALSTNFTHC